MTEGTRLPSLAVVGGGLAGLAAAVGAVERGFRVELFEQATSLGGRAGSFVDSGTGQRIDYCPHVAMGCCSQFLDFCRRTGIDDCFQRSPLHLHLIGPDGTRHDFAPSRWLPAPLHLLPGLLKLSYLSLAERWRIIRAVKELRQLSKTSSCSETPPHCNGGEADDETIAHWLRRHGQSDRALERFWSAILVSALGETLDYASLAMAQKVFCDGFLASRAASDLVLPRLPLGAIFHDRLVQWLVDRGAAVHLGAPVRYIEGDRRRATAVVLADAARHQFDALVVAVPWQNVQSLLADDLLAAMPALRELGRIEPAAITAVHLWFDRPITRLPHATLVGRRSQWMFVSNCGAGETPAPQQHCQVVISASHRLPPRKHDELVAEVRGELESVWPTTRQARLLHARVITQPAAVFSVSPGVDRFRPPQQTPVANLALAGDWTATGWPATMEGAVRSGFQAVEALRKRS